MKVGFTNFSKYVNALELEGKFVTTSIRKSPTSNTPLQCWFDLSMAPGTPRANFYVGNQLESTVYSDKYGIYAGSALPLDYNGKKFLRKIHMSNTSTTVTVKLMDYLMFYPLVDMDETATQICDNIVPLPRYIDGTGVRAMIVFTSAHTGNVTATISYTSSTGVSGRTASATMSNSGAVSALGTGGQSAVASTAGPFFPLQSGDVGVRSIESITLSGPAGGLASLVLVRPLASLQMFEANTPMEVDYFIEKTSCPVIQDGACLNLIAHASNNLSAVTVLGLFDFIWS